MNMSSILAKSFTHILIQNSSIKNTKDGERHICQEKTKLDVSRETPIIACIHMIRGELAHHLNCTHYKVFKISAKIRNVGLTRDL